jgi:VWFA-related protein
MIRRIPMIERISVSLALAACLTAALPLSAQTQDPAGREGFGEQVEVNVVNLDVFVTDKSGKPVTGLQQSDFEILEDGKRVDVAYFDEIQRGARTAEPAPAPALAGEAPAAAAAPRPATAPPADALQLVVYVDNQHLRPANRARVLKQLREFLQSEVRPGDRVMVVTFDRGLRILQPFTADTTALARALAEVEQLPARGDELVRARRMALGHTFELLNLAKSLQSTTILAAAPPTPGQGNRPNPGSGGQGGMGANGQGNRTPEGGGSEESEEGSGVAASITTPICRNDVAEPARVYAQATRQEVLASIAALKALVSSLSGLPGRKALLHVSDGLPVTPGEELFQFLFELCGGGGAANGNTGITTAIDASGIGSTGAYRAESALIDAQAYSTAKDWTLLAAHANTHRVVLYTLQASGLETFSASAADLGPEERVLQLASVDMVEMQNRQGSLSAMALDTGGRPIFNANDVRPDLARMRGDFDHYYSLGFAPRRAGERREHRIEVRLKQRGLQVRHPRSYRDKSPLETAADRTLAALLYGQGDNPLEVGLEIGEARPQRGERFNVPVRLKIPLHKLTFLDNQVELQGKIRLFVVTQDPQGEPSRLQQVEVPLKIPRDKALVALGQSYLYELTLTLPAGGQRVAVGVRDEATSLTSFVTRDVQIGQDGSSR